MSFWNWAWGRAASIVEPVMGEIARAMKSTMNEPKMTSRNQTPKPTSAEVAARLAALGPVTPTHGGEMVSSWSVSQGAGLQVVTLYRVEAARRAKLPPDQMASILAERARGHGNVLVGGTRVLVASELPAEELQAAVCR